MSETEFNEMLRRNPAIRVVGGRPLKQAQGYKSETESRWAREATLVFQALLRLRVIETLYEPETFELPGGEYTPDFCHRLNDGSLAYVETKYSKKQQNYRDARSKLRAAAALYPDFRWFEARRTQSLLGWTLEEIKPKKRKRCDSE